jgi:hypothetical protein
MPNKAALRRATERREERKQAQEDFTKREYWQIKPWSIPIDPDKKREPGEKLEFEPINFSLLTPWGVPEDGWAPLFSLHDWKGKEQMKTYRFCDAAISDSAKCDIDKIEGRFGLSKPHDFRCPIVYIHNYEGRKNKEGKPIKPIRVFAIPPGKDDKIWELIGDREETGMLANTVFQANGKTIVALKKDVKAALPNKGIVPKAIRQMFENFTAEDTLPHVINAFANPNFEYWGVDAPEVSDKSESGDESKSYSNDDDDDDARRPEDFEDEEETTPKKKSKPIAKPKAKWEVDDEEEEEESDEDEESEDEEEEEEAPPPKKKKAPVSPPPKKKKPVQQEEDDEEEDEDEDDEPPPPKKKKKRPVEDDEE